MEEFILDDSFTGEAGEYDLTLIVDGHKIRVLKTVLCVASPVFRAMLQSGFKEKNQAEVELPGKKHQDFVEFLGCFYPDKLEHVTGDSVYRIIPLAFEYQVKILEKRCHMCLVEVVKSRHLADAVEVYRHIQLAEMYELEDLRKICISAASDFKLSEIEKAASEYPIPESILVQIHHLARRKQELNKADDDYLMDSYQYGQSNVRISSIIEDQYGQSNVRISSIIEEQYSHFSQCIEKSMKLRAARMWYRYFQKHEDKLEKIIKSTKGMKIDDDIKEEYELLPETLKQQLNLKHN